MSEDIGPSAVNDAKSRVSAKVLGRSIKPRHWSEAKQSS
jgi:hypothetical protein